MKIKIKTETHWERWRVSTFYDKEPETIAWIYSFDGKGSFWDIGANIGVYSLFCAWCHPKMEVHAFEPYRANFMRLWENIFLNDFFRVTAHYLAVGDKDGYAAFKQPRVDVGASGGQIDRGRNAAPTTDIKKDTALIYEIESVTGDQLWSQCGPPRYIKIDTDGNEWEILQGMRTLLKSVTYGGHGVKSVLVEVNDHSEEIYKLMADCGFEPDARFNDLKNRDMDFNVVFSRE